MNDSKYVRLYPERAVAPLRDLAKKQLDWAQQDSDDDAIAELTAVLRALDELGFPPDEPLFLLRGQDTLAPDTVIFYASLVDARDADLDIGHLKQHANRMRAWQPRKLPD